eukprot:CAMPEP_0115226600 /NCGR_PEP_ID=MMETSP0270-20121206/30712_1 /TAXON_ID=71861 /ORGANISM="Scrippsiella trochoidea, Strain CCMP3099" /LENGTH=55 /DNA_ID=CAMNT_0002641023 /DNA_START=160 /DNA_END=324 /DNA_ORIENTATION=-
MALKGVQTLARSNLPEPRTLIIRGTSHLLTLRRESCTPKPAPMALQGVQALARSR